MNAYNIISDEAEFSFMVIAAKLIPTPSIDIEKETL